MGCHKILVVLTVTMKIRNVIEPNASQTNIHPYHLVLCMPIKISAAIKTSCTSQSACLYSLLKGHTGRGSPRPNPYDGGYLLPLASAKSAVVTTLPSSSIALSLKEDSLDQSVLYADKVRLKRAECRCGGV